MEVRGYGGPGPQLGVGCEGIAHNTTSEQGCYGQPRASKRPFSSYMDFTQNKELLLNATDSRSNCEVLGPVDEMPEKAQIQAHRLPSVS